jgi:hypothetical protein
MVVESITKALNNLKIGKAPGIDDIPNEFLKYGGDIMIKSLSDLFTQQAKRPSRQTLSKAFDRSKKAK